MDVSEKIERSPNPFDNAGILSKISFGFVWTTFREGLKKDFQSEDLYEIAKKFEACTLGNLLEKEWNKEKKKKNPKIHVTIFKIFGSLYLFCGLLYVIMSTAGSLVRPRLKGKFVSYFSPNQTDLSETDAYFYGGALVGFNAFYTLMLHYYFFILEQIGLKVKISLASLIYRKSLKLSAASISQKGTGDVVTLITKDLLTLDHAAQMANHFWVGFIQIIILTIVMYQEIQVSSLAGTGVILFSLPLQLLIGRIITKYRKKTSEKTDQRVRTTQEMLTALRTIKMYTWEKFFLNKIQSQRHNEILYWRILAICKILAHCLGGLISKFSLYICIIIYTALGNNVTAEKAFVVTGCFAILTPVVMGFIPGSIMCVSDSLASMRRINKFLLLPEIRDNFTVNQIIGVEPKILIKQVNVESENGDLVLRDINLEIKPGLTVLTGMVGAGKSTLLKLMFGDAFNVEGYVELTGTFSYSSQEPWLFPSTIKQNIIFNEPFDVKRYYSVIKVCDLEKDLGVFPDGDQTRVTDKGLNLSRGQKTRINLARSIYKTADIYLLDDCLSAVDDGVANNIFQNLTSFLDGKIWMFVTYKQHFISKAASVVMIKEGSIAFHGNHSDFKNLKDYDPSFLKIGNEIFIHDYDSNQGNSEKLYNEEEGDEGSKLLTTTLKNVYAENTNKGTVSKDVYLTYFRSAGGIKVFLIVIALSITSQIIASWSDYFVSFWVDVEQKMSVYRMNKTTEDEEYENLKSTRNTILTTYSFVIIGIFSMMLLKSAGFLYFFSNASKNIHKIILKNIVNAYMKFFDINLSGNVLNRFSRDMSILDEVLPMIVFEVITIVIFLVSIVFVISTANPFFLIPSLILLTLLVAARWLYITTSRSIRRLEGATRSPLVGQFNATLDGLSTIRASGAEQVLQKEFDHHQNLYNSAVFINLTISRSLGIYLDGICCIYVAVIVLSFLVFRIDSIAGTVGLVITQSFYLTGILQWGVRQWAELENHMTATERILEYNKVESEVKTGSKPDNWPTNGIISFKKVSLRYFPTSERILKDISFEIYPKFKVGVVGRTGAGKTSILATLFRLYDFRGTIFIDGADINCIAVEHLRSKISIIPQDPVLFTGTIRSNLDPYENYTDKDLWKALEEVKLKEIISDLDQTITDGGSNFSIGQRQLLSLARAIVRNNEILVLDEATANMDQKTDNLIQNTIKERFNNCTVITIAHRIDTVMDSDRILVMELGQILEYDNPHVLLSNKNGHFYKMVKAAGLKSS